MKSYQETPVSEQFNKNKKLIYVLLVIILAIAIFLGITFYKGRTLVQQPPKEQVDLTKCKSEMARLVILLNTEQYKAAGIMKAWTEGDDGHILKMYVNAKWYAVNYEDKKKLMEKLYSIWYTNAGTINSAARIEVFDQKSGKKIASAGSWGIKITK